MELVDIRRSERRALWAWEFDSPLVTERNCAGAAGAQLVLIRLVSPDRYGARNYGPGTQTGKATSDQLASMPVGARNLVNCEFDLSLRSLRTIPWSSGKDGRRGSSAMDYRPALG